MDGTRGSRDDAGDKPKPVDITCGECGARFRVKRSMTGRTVACRNCGEPMRVGAATGRPKREPLTRTEKDAYRRVSTGLVLTLTAVVLICCVMPVMAYASAGGAVSETVVVAGVFGMLGLEFLGLVGAVMCASAPPEAESRPAAVGTAVLLAIAISLAGCVFVLEGHRTVQVLAIVRALVSFAAALSFTHSMKSLAEFLNAKEAASSGGSLIVMLWLTLVSLLLVFTPIGLAAIIFLLGSAIYFVRTVKQLREAIRLGIESSELPLRSVAVAR